MFPAVNAAADATDPTNKDARIPAPTLTVRCMDALRQLNVLPLLPSQAGMIVTILASPSNAFASL